MIPSLAAAAPVSTTLATSQSQPAANRNATVDLFRLVPSFGVGAIHVHNSTPAAQGITAFFWPLCVPFFYAVSLRYFVAGLGRTLVTTVVTRAGACLLTPYLVWTTITAYLGLTFWPAPQLANRYQRWSLAGLGLLLASTAVGANMTGFVAAAVVTWLASQSALGHRLLLGERS